MIELMEKRILVVSDDSQFCRAVTLALADQGYQTTVASSLKDARELGGTAKPHVLVTDLVNDVETECLQLAEDLRREAPHMQCLVIGDPETTEHIALVGDPARTHVVQRPFSMIRLLTATDVAMRCATALANQHSV